MNSETHKDAIRFIWRLLVTDGRKETIIQSTMREYGLERETAEQIYEEAVQTCKEFTAVGIQGNERYNQELHDYSRYRSLQQENEGILQRPGFWKTSLGILAVFSIILPLNIFITADTEEIPEEEIADIANLHDYDTIEYDSCLNNSTDTTYIKKDNVYFCKNEHKEDSTTFKSQAIFGRVIGNSMQYDMPARFRGPIIIPKIPKFPKVTEIPRIPDFTKIPKVPKIPKVRIPPIRF